MKFKLNIQNPYEYLDIPNQFVFQRWINTTLESLIDSAELTIRIVDESEIKNLNNQYRNKNKPTNVLSFPFDLPKDIIESLEHPFIGDIIICHPIVCLEAQEQHKALDAHYAHLTIHGILHLLGYDHIELADAKIMEPLEIKILDKLNYRNPYELYDD